MDNDHFGTLIAQRLIDVRETRDLTQVQLSKLSGVGTKTIGRYEAEGPSKFEELGLLAKALGMGLHEFLRPIFDDGMGSAPADVRDLVRALAKLPEPDRREAIGILKGFAIARERTLAP